MAPGAFSDPKGEYHVHVICCTGVSVRSHCPGVREKIQCGADQPGDRAGPGETGEPAGGETVRGFSWQTVPDPAGDHVLLCPAPGKWDPGQGIQKADPALRHQSVLGAHCDLSGELRLVRHRPWGHQRPDGDGTVCGAPGLPSGCQSHPHGVHGHPGSCGRDRLSHCPHRDHCGGPAGPDEDPHAGHGHFCRGHCRQCPMRPGDLSGVQRVETSGSAGPA